MSLTAAAVGLSALLLMIVLSRTRISSVASLIALIVPTVVSLGAGSLVGSGAGRGAYPHQRSDTPSSAPVAADLARFGLWCHGGMCDRARAGHRGVPIPTLAAVLMYAAGRSPRVGRIDTVLRTEDLPSQIAFFATLKATLLLPVSTAVGIGVVLSLLLQLNQEAVDLTLVGLKPDGTGGFAEVPAPATLASHHVTALDVYRSLLFAGARTLQTRLPDPAGAESCACVAAPHSARPRSSFWPTTASVFAPPMAICFSAACAPSSSSGCATPAGSTCARPPPWFRREPGLPRAGQRTRACQAEISSPGGGLRILSACRPSLVLLLLPRFTPSSSPWWL